jgi:subtilisin family serine protease
MGKEATNEVEAAGEPVFRLPEHTVHRLMLMQEVGEQLPWWITDLAIEDYWDTTGAGEGVRIGISDTGVDKTHLETGDLKGQVAEMKDFSGSKSGAIDLNGHGSHCAGTIAAKYRNDFRIAGLAHNAKLYIGKSLGDRGQGSDKSVANSIHWMCDNDCHLINLSLGSDQPGNASREACKRAFDEGRIIVAAAGNGGRSNGVGYPSKYPTTFSVGAVDRRKEIASFSDRGPEVDGVGFGVKILSLYLRGTVAVLSGTSMSTPFCAGLMANRISYALKNDKPVPTLTDIHNVLLGTAEDLGKPGRDPEYGVGFPRIPDFFTAGLDNGDDLPGDGGFTLPIGDGWTLRTPAQAGGTQSLSIHGPAS